MKKTIFILICLLQFACKEKTDFKNEEKKVIKIIENVDEQINQSNVKFPNYVFPKKSNVLDLKNTDFVETIESEFVDNKNIIYTSSLLFAWNEIKNSFKIIQINPDDKELNLLNKSVSFKKSLNKNEVKTEISITNYEIKSKAHFEKSLPFFSEINKFYYPLNFKNKNVQSFGFNRGFFTYSKENIDDFFEIMYYKNDSEFIFKLFTKDKEDEILIYKFNNSKYKTLTYILKEIENKITIAKNEIKSEKNKWKYKYDDSSDLLQIPVIEFNLEKDFEKLLKKQIKCDSLNYFTTKVYQRNAFLLNEKGAIIESEASLDAAASAQRPTETPKKFILDNDFVIIVSKKDNKEPYFMSIIKNEELMKIF